MITNKELTTVLRAYRAGSLPKPLLRKCFVKIVEYVFDHSSYHFECKSTDRQNIIGGAASLCVKKVDRFDEECGKACNFFITIIGCFLRQERQMLRNRTRIEFKKYSSRL